MENTQTAIRPIVASAGTGTCAEACWFAREESCRCSCNGSNHGILLVNGQEHPKRSRRIGGHRYELNAVVIGYGAAKSAAYGLGAEGWPVKNWIVQGAPTAAFKWPELSSFQPSRFFQDHPHLIWVIAD